MRSKDIEHQHPSACILMRRFFTAYNNANFPANKIPSLKSIRLFSTNGDFDFCLNHDHLITSPFTSSARYGMDDYQWFSFHVAISFSQFLGNFDLE